MIIKKFPNKIKYKKLQKGKLRGKSPVFSNQQILFGNYALKILQNGRLTYKQLEAARKVVTSTTKRCAKIWLRASINTPITSKPKEVRMGKGKGSVSYWICKVKRGQILFEIDGVAQEQASITLLQASRKLPVATKLIFK